MTINEYNLAVDNYSDRLYRFVLKSIKDLHKAEDIVQDSFEKLWKNIDNVDGNKVKSYLFTTAYHTMIDRIRKEKRSLLMDDDSMIWLHNHLWSRPSRMHRGNTKDRCATGRGDDADAPGQSR